MTDITANVVIGMPSQLFTMARSFKAVANGKIYIGKIDTDPVNPENQIQVYVENEDGSHIPVAQPIIINAAGYPVYNGQIAKFVTVQGHSMAVYDAYGAQQFYFPNVLKYDPDQLRKEITSTGKGKGADMIPLQQGGTVQSAIYYVTPSSAGITGDGTDEGEKLIYLLNRYDGYVIDLSGMTIKTSEMISVVFNKKTTIRNGTIIYTGAVSPFVLKITCSSVLSIEDIAIDGKNNAAKLLYALSSDNNAKISISGYSGRNAREAIDTGLSTAAYITAGSLFRWKEIRLSDSSAYDISSSGGSNVGRGFMVQNFEYCYVRNISVFRVGPYQDADGIYASSPNYLSAVFDISDSYFEDCQKRSVKSQIMNSRVSNIVERRTQAFAVAAGQSAVDLQAGGSLDGLSCFYADGAAPQSIVSGGLVSGAPTFRGISLRNIDVNCEDPSDIISRLVSFYNNSPNTYDGYIAENIKCNAIIENVGFLYSNTGNTNFNSYLFKEVIFRNIQSSGMAGTVPTAVIQISRGSSAYVKAIVRVQNLNLGDGNIAPLYYLDPLPGVTTFLDVLFRQVSNCRGFDTLTNVNSDTSQRIYAVTADVAENESTTLLIPIKTTNGKTAVKISVMYNSNRDEHAAKLFTEGYWFFGLSLPYYIESVAGVKTQTNVGSIVVTVAENNLVVKKIAGTTAASGRMTVIIEHISCVNM